MQPTQCHQQQARQSAVVQEGFACGLLRHAVPPVAGAAQESAATQEQPVVAMLQVLGQ